MTDRIVFVPTLDHGLELRDNAPVLPRTASILSFLALAGCGALIGLDEYGPSEQGAGGATSTGGAGATGGGGGASEGGASACTPRMGQGGCVALGNDKNCAYCGNDCLNGGCVAGACTAGKVGTVGGYGLAGDETHIFFRNEVGDTMYRIATKALDLVSPEPIASGLTGVRTLIVDGSHVYFSPPGSISRMEKNGASPELLASPAVAEDSANAMLVDGGYLYYTTNYSPSFRRISLTGAFPTTESTVADVFLAMGLAHDDDAFYFTTPGDDNASNGAVWYFSKSSLGQTTQAHKVADSVERPFHIVAVADALYFSSGTRVLRVPKMGGTTPALVKDFGLPVAALATDGCELFVAAGPNDMTGEVWAVDLDGQNGVQLHTGVNVFLGGVRGSRDAVFHSGLSGVFRIVR